MLLLTGGSAAFAADAPLRDAHQPPSLEHRSACPVAPSGPDYSGQDLTNRNFHDRPAGSLRGANFENAILKGARFDGQDLTGASFRGADLGPSGFGPVNFSGAVLHETCFIDAILNATRFTFAEFRCTDFSGTSLMHAEFGPRQQIAAGDGCRTDFSHATLDVNAITTDHWGQIDFTRTNFQNVSPSTFSLKGKDITGAILVGANFSSIDMTGANLTGVDFSGANLIAAKLDDAALNGVRLVHADLTGAGLSCARFYGAKGDDKDNPNGKACPDTPDSRDPRKAADLTQAVFRGANLSHATLNFAVLHGANLSGATLRNASFIHADLTPSGTLPAASVLGADLTDTYFSGAAVNFVQFNSVILTRARFNDATLQGTSFNGVIMPDVSFDGSILENVSFHGSVLQQARFTGTTMKTTPDSGGTGVDFTCTQLGGSDFSNATITAADFQAAVMPPAGECCPPKAGFNWCGTIDITQEAYGPVTFPVLNASVYCPNGEVAPCTGRQWIIPGWQTRDCSPPPDHALRTVWSKPPCDAPPGDIVHFKDDNLKSCILEMLPGHPSEVTVQTAQALPEVRCPGRQIEDLTGLEHFTSLLSLDLSANRIEQYALPLPNLQSLKIANNALTLLDLSNTTGLVRLDASNNRLKSIQHLDILQALEVLDVSGNALTALDLAIQDTLIYADASDNQLASVLDAYNPSLDRLTSLSYLDLSGNSLSSVGALSAIANSAKQNPDGRLAFLEVGCNAGFDCAALQLDGSYRALQTSQCAEFNSANNQWVVLKTPKCPTR
ncbi:pentapeptide repeat-containing protein [Thioalkalivibrio paradoxus]|uniref:pentapeptide repeat-containing protein n=1 Tax=Thioalkalivibrio paradoxus TaxID=108010 RepID=UPI00046CCE80|nr:pentapeptide repeat-containing protein [Thioalkalivibrio paradoxus]